MIYIYILSVYGAWILASQDRFISELGPFSGFDFTASVTSLFLSLTHEHLSYNCILYAQYSICQSVYNSKQNLLCFTRLFTIYTNNNIVAVPTTILIPTDSRIRQFHPFTYWYRHLHAFKDPYKYSFFPNTIIHWNLLPQTIVLTSMPNSQHV
jgi:hypothetical protein